MKKIAILAIIILAVGGGIVAYASESKGSSNDNSINNTIQSSDSNTNNNNNGQSYNQGNGENNSNNTEVENQNSNDTNSGKPVQSHTNKAVETTSTTNSNNNDNPVNFAVTGESQNIYLVATSTLTTPISLQSVPSEKASSVWQFNEFATGKLISEGDKWDKVMIENKVGYVPKANVAIGTLVNSSAETINKQTMIYSSPNTNSQVVEVLLQNTSVWVQSNNDGWSNIYIPNSTVSGYILTKDLKFESKS